jgi:hypothetical protein
MSISRLPSALVLSRRRVGLACLAIAAMMATTVQIDLNAANPSATLDQWANLDNAWVNGNLGASKSTYFEGDSIPYRLRFDNLPLTTHHVIIEWDTTKASKHAIDYLTTFNRLVGKVPNAPNPPLNPCANVSNCVYATNSTFGIPVDPQVSGAGVTQAAGNFTIWGGTITGVSAYAYNDGAGFVGDKSARIDIAFTATRANPVISWGGRIATRKDWGNNNSAVAISGSPYHTRLADLDGAGGNQDRSLSAAAVIFPALINITKEVRTSAGSDTGIDAQAFQFTGSGQVAGSLSLYDDGSIDNPDATPKSGSIELLLFGNSNQEVVTESVYGSFDQTASCQITEAGLGGGAVTGAGIVKTVTPVEGMVVDCTFFNKIKAATLTVIKTVVNNNGGTAQASAFTIHVISGGTDYANEGGVASPGKAYTLSAGTYVVSESSLPTGYSSDGITGDCNAAGSITLAAGDNKTCTITNNDVSPSLTLKKIVSNTHGGNAKAEDFTLTATGPSTLSGKPAAGQDSITGNVDAGSYTLSESTVPTGYTAAGPYSCVVGAGSPVVSNSLTLAPGDVATCTITNNDSPAVVTPTTSQKAILHDSIHLTGIRPLNPGPSSANITFRLYTDAACTVAASNTAYPAGYVEQVAITYSGSNTVGDASTSSGFLTSQPGGTFFWKVTYSGDANNGPKTTSCGGAADERAVITLSGS